MEGEAGRICFTRQCRKCQRPVSAGLTIARRRLPGGQGRPETLASRLVGCPYGFISRRRQGKNLATVETDKRRRDKIFGGS